MANQKCDCKPFTQDINCCQCGNVIEVIRVRKDLVLKEKEYKMLLTMATYFAKQQQNWMELVSIPKDEIEAQLYKLIELQNLRDKIGQIINAK